MWNVKLDGRWDHLRALALMLAWLADSYEGHPSATNLGIPCLCVRDSVI